MEKKLQQLQRQKLKIKPVYRVIIIGNALLMIMLSVSLISANIGLPKNVFAEAVKTTESVSEEFSTDFDILTESATETEAAKSYACSTINSGVSSEESAALLTTLKNFSVKENDNIVSVTWTTATEKDNDHFTIERSTNGHDFTEIGKEQGAGFSRYALSYSFPDESPVSGDCYYRLSQTDVDGNITTFAPVHIKTSLLDAGDKITAIGPLPIKDHLKIDYSVKEAGAVTFILLNKEGQIIKSSEAMAGEGLNSFRMDDLSVSSGIYILHMKTAEETKSVKIANL